LFERLKDLGRRWKPIHLCWLFRALGLPVPRYFIGTTAAVYDQESFRFRDDDGSESAATWHGLLNADAADLANDTNYRIRINVKEQNVAVGSNENITFHYSYKGGAWTAITTISSYIKAIASANFNDLDESTQQLTSGGFDTTNNAMSETGAAGSNALDPPQASYVETELCFQIVSADVANGDTIDIRVLFDGALDTWTEVPRITVLKANVYNVYAADNLNFSEGNAENADFVEAGSDTLNLSDGTLENADFAETASDVLSFIDGSIGTKAGGVVYNVEGGEVLNFSDGSLENILRILYSADVLNLSDGSLENSIFDKKSSDIINFTDGSLENVIFVRKASDFINFSEGNLENVVFARSASDVLNLSDGSLRKMDFNEKSSDQILFSDGSAASVPGGSAPSPRKTDFRVFGPGIRG